MKIGGKMASASVLSLSTTLWGPDQVSNPWLVMYAVHQLIFCERTNVKYHTFPGKVYATAFH